MHTIEKLSVDTINGPDCLLPVVSDEKVTFDAVLLKRFAEQLYVTVVIFE
jgi:hypothetical protein